MVAELDASVTGPASAAFPPRGAYVEPIHSGDIARRAAALAREGRAIVPMHFGQPTGGAAKSAVAAAHAALAGPESGYVESMALRERLSRHYFERYGLEVSVDRILLTAGASAGLVALYASLFAPGDRIGIVRPGYPAYRNTLTGLRLQPVEIDCDAGTQFHLRAQAVAQVPGDLHGLVVASPANPTGAVLDRDELTAIAAACRARGTRLISDEIYHGITFGSPVTCALEVDPDAIIVNSFSKFFRMPGWRLGWIVLPPGMAPQLSAYLLNFFLTPPTLSQVAALAAFEDLAELEASVEVYRRNREMLVDALPRIGFPSILAPEGAFYLYIDVRHLTNDSMNFCRRLLQDTGIAWAPGIDFDPVRGHGFVRLSFAVATAEVERALDLLRPWLESQRT